jgi:hypothetical protein
MQDAYGWTFGIIAAGAGVLIVAIWLDLKHGWSRTKGKGGKLKPLLNAVQQITVMILFPGKVSHTAVPTVHPHTTPNPRFTPVLSIKRVRSLAPLPHYSLAAHGRPIRLLGRRHPPSLAVIWPDSVKKLGSIFDGLSFDVSLISPTCIGIETNFYVRFVASALLAFACILVPFLVAVVVALCKALASHRGGMIGEEGEGDEGGNGGGAAASPFKVRFLKHWKHAVPIAATYGLISVLFAHPGVSGHAMYFFSCHEILDMPTTDKYGTETVATRSYMVADYSLECYDKAWFAMLPFAVFVLAAFSVGVPAFLFVLMYNRRHVIYKISADSIKDSIEESTHGDVDSAAKQGATGARPEINSEAGAVDAETTLATVGGGDVSSKEFDVDVGSGEHDGGFEERKGNDHLTENTVHELTNKIDREYDFDHDSGRGCSRDNVHIRESVRIASTAVEDGHALTLQEILAVKRQAKEMGKVAEGEENEFVAIMLGVLYGVYKPECYYFDIVNFVRCNYTRASQHPTTTLALHPLPFTYALLHPYITVHFSQHDNAWSQHASPHTPPVLGLKAARSLASLCAPPPPTTLPVQLQPLFPSPTRFTRVRRATFSLHRTGTQVGSLGGAGLLWIRFAAASGDGDPHEHGAPLAPHTLRAVYGQVRLLMRQAAIFVFRWRVLESALRYSSVLST